MPPESAHADNPDCLHPVMWRAGTLELIDQRRLPRELRINRYDTVDGVIDAIAAMVVRGAPAIGIAAAYGVVLAAREAYAAYGDDWRAKMDNRLAPLRGIRPTAVNLQWAVNRMALTFEGIDGNPVPPLLAKARAIHDEDVAANQRMGELGAALIDGACEVVTHCNAGALATGGYGTALGVIRHAHGDGKITRVFTGETRPLLQGARLTCWELQRDHIPVTSLIDSAVCHLMSRGGVRWLIVGADRIAANGDVCNKIGTLAHALCARHHGVKVMVVAPTSSIDPETATGGDVPIEMRAEDEVLNVAGTRIVTEGVGAWTPAFDVTPAALVDYLVTEKGVIQNPGARAIKTVLVQTGALSVKE